MNKSREQFEELALDNKLSLDVTSGCYTNRDTRLAWDVWKASRESLEVELPRKHDVDDEYDYFAMGYNLALNKIHDLLVEKGVKVK